jgi:hypothetical protein
MKRKTDETTAGDAKRYVPDVPPTKSPSPTALKFVSDARNRPLGRSRNMFFDEQNNLVFVQLKVMVKREEQSISCACVIDKHGQFYASVHGHSCLYVFDEHAAADPGKKLDDDGCFHVVMRGTGRPEKTLVFERNLAKCIEMHRPDDLALSLDEDMLYVNYTKSDFPAAYAVKKFRVSDMTEVLEFGEDLMKFRPAGLAVLSTGQIATACGGKILIFNEDGSLAQKFAGPLEYGFKRIAVDINDNIYAIGFWNSALVVFSRDGTVIAQYPDLGRLCYPTRIAIDRLGRVAVADLYTDLQFFE